MRKLISILFASVISSAMLFAAIPSLTLTSDTFRSPARLVEIEEESNFSMSLDASSAVKGIMFIADPVDALKDGMNHLGEAMQGLSDEFIASNYESIADAFDFDSNFPTAGHTAAETAYFVREYFAEGGGFDSLPENDKALAMAALLSIDPALLPHGYLPNDLDILIDFNWGAIREGFGLKWIVDLGFNGADDLLDQYSYGYADKYYGNELYVSAGADIGYAEYIIEDRLSVGFSLSPRFFFDTSLTNGDYLSARLNGDIIGALAANRYNAGFGLGFNLGVMYRMNEELAFMVDLRDIPTFRSYWYFTAEDIMNGFKLHYDRNLYLTPPDLAFTILYDVGPYHLGVELSDAVSQTVWACSLDNYSYDPWIIPKLYFGYDINEDMTVSAKVEYRSLKVGLEMKNLDIELSSRLDRLAFGFKVGCSI